MTARHIPQFNLAAQPASTRRWSCQDRTARHHQGHSSMDWLPQTLSPQPRFISTGRRKLRGVGLAQTKGRTWNGAISSCSANLSAQAAAALSTMVHMFAMRPDRRDTAPWLVAGEIGRHTRSGRANGDNEPIEAGKFIEKAHGDVKRRI